MPRPLLSLSPNTSPRPSTSFSCAPKNHREIQKTSSNAPQLLSVQMQTLLTGVQTSLTWHQQFESLIPHLLTYLPEWPVESALIILNEHKEEILKICPPKGNEQHSAITLLKEGNYYSAYRKHNNAIIPITRDGDSFYNALLASLKEHTSAYHCTWLSSTPSPERIRLCLASYICTHTQEVEQLTHTLNNHISPSVNKDSHIYDQHTAISSTYPLSAHTIFPRKNLTLGYYTQKNSNLIINQVQQTATLSSSQPIITSSNAIHSSAVFGTEASSTARGKEIDPAQKTSAISTIAPQVNLNYKNIILPSIYATANNLASLPKTVLELINDYRYWIHSLPLTTKEDSNLFSENHNHFLVSHAITWQKLSPYIKINGRRTIAGNQWERRMQGKQFTPITTELLLACRKQITDRPIIGISKFNKFVRQHNIFSDDLEKLCSRSGCISLYGIQAMALLDGKHFKQITAPLVNQYLLSLSSLKSYLDPMELAAHRRNFCKEENILLEQFEIFLLINQHIEDHFNLLARYNIIKEKITPLALSTDETHPQLSQNQDNTELKLLNNPNHYRQALLELHNPSIALKLTLPTSSIEKNISADINSILEADLPTKSSSELSKKLSYAAIQRSLEKRHDKNILPSIYAVPHRFISSSKVSIELLDEYRNWYESLQNTNKSPALFSYKQNLFLKSYGLTWPEVSPYMFINGKKTKMGLQLEKKMRGYQFNVITAEVLKEYAKIGSANSKSNISFFNLFAQTHNLFLEDLEKLCNRAGSITSRGQQALALHAGHHFIPITNAIITEYLDSWLQTEKSESNPKNHLENFCIKKNIFIEELEKYLIEGHLLSDDSNLLARYKNLLEAQASTMTSVNNQQEESRYMSTIPSSSTSDLVLSPKITHPPTYMQSISGAALTPYKYAVPMELNNLFPIEDDITPQKRARYQENIAAQNNHLSTVQLAESTQINQPHDPIYIDICSPYQNTNSPLPETSIVETITLANLTTVNKNAVPSFDFEPHFNHESIASYTSTNFTPSIYSDNSINNFSNTSSILLEENRWSQNTATDFFHYPQTSFSYPANTPSESSSFAQKYNYDFHINTPPTQYTDTLIFPISQSLPHADRQVENTNSISAAQTIQQQTYDPQNFIQNTAYPAFDSQQEVDRSYTSSIATQHTSTTYEENEFSSMNYLNESLNTLEPYSQFVFPAPNTALQDTPQLHNSEFYQRPSQATYSTQHAVPLPAISDSALSTINNPIEHARLARSPIFQSVSTSEITHTNPPINAAAESSHDGQQAKRAYLLIPPLPYYSLIPIPEYLPPHTLQAPVIISLQGQMLPANSVLHQGNTQIPDIPTASSNTTTFVSANPITASTDHPTTSNVEGNYVQNEQRHFQQAPSTYLKY